MNDKESRRNMGTDYQLLSPFAQREWTEVKVDIFEALACKRHKQVFFH